MAATTVYDSDGTFRCYGIFLFRDTLLVPDVAKELWYKGARLDRLLKRSRRHYYQLYRVTAAPEERIYSVFETDIHAVGQTCTFLGKSIKYIATVDSWRWNEEGGYSLQLNVPADPRLNGCRVLTTTTPPKLLGMALSTLGFVGMLQCIPIDVIVENMHTPLCYSSVMPTLPLWEANDGACFHPSYGYLSGNMRDYDKRAERALDTTYLSVQKEEDGRMLYVTGGVNRDFPPIPVQPCIEFGVFVFQRSRFGKVECVFERDTDQTRKHRRDVVVMAFCNRVLRKINNTEISTFESLLEYCSTKHNPKGAYVIMWADGRVERIQETGKPPDETEFTIGRQISPHATLWFDKIRAKKAEENREKDEGDDGRSIGSCDDPCLYA